VTLSSACKLYVAQAKHYLHSIFGRGSEDAAKFTEYAVHQYGQCLGYRVMDALINYAQHRGFPIHSVTYSAGWVESQSGSMNRYSVTPCIELEDLARDEKFKKAVLDELKSLGARVDLKPLIREYIAALGNLHEEVRKMLRAHTQEWEQTIQQAIDRFYKEYPDENPTAWLVAVAQNDDETTSEAVGPTP
jgi:hypothetical protein